MVAHGDLDDCPDEAIVFLTIIGRPLAEWQPSDPGASKEVYERGMRDHATATWLWGQYTMAKGHAETEMLIDGVVKGEG